MKQHLVLFMAIVLTLTFAACGKKEQKDVTNAIKGETYSIDYKDAESFENALNNGTKVKGKIVQFYVSDYVPNSILGVNCHAGEHLNFLFDNELDVTAGDTIVIEVTKEPSKIFLTDSWKITCEFLEFGKTYTESENIANVNSNTDSITENSNETPTATPTATPTTTPPHIHSFIPATCTSPKICSCGATEGEANGHNWKNATYTSPKTCTDCGTTEGSALDVPGKANYHGHVYTGGDKSTKYHYESECAGKYSHEITWEEVDRRALEPCGTCVLN